jgi:hypothetical protein
LEVNGGLNLYALDGSPSDGSDPLGLAFFRGAKPGEAPTFKHKPNEVKIKDGKVQPTHGVSVFDNAQSVESKGFDAHEIDEATIPSTLQVKQRGKDPRHFEIMPKDPMTEEQFAEDLGKIKTKPAMTEKPH